MMRKIMLLFEMTILMCSFAFTQELVPFNASLLIKIGDKVEYGIYTVCKIGEGIYQISDHELHQPEARLGATGSAIYLICGEKKAMIIDLGNNYIDGNTGDNLKPRKFGAEEFRAIVYGLAGKLPIEAAVTHMHVDHDGMTGALMNRKEVTLWASDKENVPDIKKQHGIDPSVYTLFTAGDKSFDLGGGRVVYTFLVRGHTNGGTVFLLKKDGLVFTGDAFVAGIGTDERLKLMVEDLQKLVNYVFANFSPYERYAIRVYPAHAHTVGEEAKVDIAFQDWRFLQDMINLANGIVKGTWQEKGSGFHFEEEIRSESSAAPRGSGGGSVGVVSGYLYYGVAKLRMSINEVK